MGCIYSVTESYEEALKQFLLFIQLAPNDAIGYKYIGKLFHQKARNSGKREDWISAQEALQQALVLDSSDANTLDELAVVLYELEDFTEAITTSMAAVRLAPNDHRITHNLDAICGQIIRRHVFQGRWREAWGVFRTVLDSQKRK